MNVVFLLAAIVLLAVNAFMVAAEVAITAAAGRRSAIEAQAALGGYRARLASTSLRELAFMLTGAQFGITLASLGLGFVAEPAIADLIIGTVGDHIGLPEIVVHGIAAAIALTLIVFLHMVLGEMAPKNIAIAEPIRTMLWVAVPFRAYANAIRPVLWALNGMANLVVRAVGVIPREELQARYTASQIAEMLTALRRIGAIDMSDYRMAQGAIGLETRKAATSCCPDRRSSPFPPPRPCAKSRSWRPRPDTPGYRCSAANLTTFAASFTSRICWHAPTCVRRRRCRPP